MATLTHTDDWRTAFPRSRIIAIVWSDQPAYIRTQREKLAVAMALGKPIRLVVLVPVRVPEDVCCGYADFQVARLRSPEEIGPQVCAWIEEVKAREENEPHA